MVQGMAMAWMEIMTANGFDICQLINWRQRETGLAIDFYSWPGSPTVSLYNTHTKLPSIIYTFTNQAFLFLSCLLTSQPSIVAIPESMRAPPLSSLDSNSIAGEFLYKALPSPGVARLTYSWIELLGRRDLGPC